MKTRVAVARTLRVHVHARVAQHVDALELERLGERRRDKTVQQRLAILD